MDSKSEQPKIVTQDEGQMQKLRDQLATATDPKQKEAIRKEMAQLIVDNLSSKA